MRKHVLFPVVFVASLVAAVLLASCAAQTPVSPPAEPATSTPAASPTRTPRPSRTPSPTCTPYPTRTPTATALPSATPEPTPTPGPTIGFELVGQVGGAPLALAVQGTRAYVGVGPRLVVVDLSDPHSPRVVGKLSRQELGIRGYLYDFNAWDNFLYVLHEGGIAIVDVSRPHAPRLVGSYDAEFPWWGSRPDRLVAAEGYLYMNGHECALAVLDARDLAQVVPVQCLDSSGRALAVADGWLCVGGSSFMVLDLGDPAAPQLRGGLPAGGDPDEIAVGSEYLYLLGWHSDVRVIDITDRSAPRQVGQLRPRWSAYGSALDGSWLYVAAGGSGLGVLDVSNPRQPRVAGVYHLWGSANDIVVYDGLVLLADGQAGLLVLRPVFP